MNILTKAAEILVVCGYAEGRRGYGSPEYKYTDGLDLYVDGVPTKCDPFADTLEGRRQLEAIYNHLFGVDARQALIDAVKQEVGK